MIDCDVNWKLKIFVFGTTEAFHVLFFRFSFWSTRELTAAWSNKSSVIVKSVMSSSFNIILVSCSFGCVWHWRGIHETFSHKLSSIVWQKALQHKIVKKPQRKKIQKKVLEKKQKQKLQFHFNWQLARRYLAKCTSKQWTRCRV